MTQEPKRWRTYFVDNSIREASGAIQQRVWASDFERPNTFPVIELDCVRELVEALKFYANNEHWKIDHKTSALLSCDSHELDFGGKRALEALSKLPPDVLEGIGVRE